MDQMKIRTVYIVSTHQVDSEFIKSFPMPLLIMQYANLLRNLIRHATHCSTSQHYYTILGRPSKTNLQILTNAPEDCQIVESMQNAVKCEAMLKLLH